jgi:hypothetical protein
VDRVEIFTMTELEGRFVQEEPILLLALWSCYLKTGFFDYYRDSDTSIR